MGGSGCAVEGAGVGVGLIVQTAGSPGHEGTGAVVVDSIEYIEINKRHK